MFQTITPDTIKSLAVGAVCAIILIAGFKYTSRNKKSGGSNNTTNSAPTPPSTTDADKK